METKLKKEVKYWSSIKKWCVAYWSPEYGKMENAFHKNLEKAERQALINIKKRINFEREFRALSEKSEITLVF